MLGGGDDYEILFTAPPALLGAIAGLARRLDLPLTVIGRMTGGSGVRIVVPDGGDLVLDTPGFRHF